MKKFTQLALVSSIAISANAMAMQAMDDAALSASTGQDGINIGIGISKVTIDKLFVHDNDGLNGTQANAGAIVIKGASDANKSAITLTNGQAYSNADFGVYVGANYSNAGAYLLASRNLADLQIDSDAGTSAKGGAFLNIAAQVSGLEIHLGEIGVTASGTAGSGTNAGTIRRGGDDTNYNAILSGLSIKTGTMSANVQLGAAPQGAMIKLNTTMIGGLEIANLGILDNSTKLGTGDGSSAANRAAGVIHLDSIKVANTGKTDLDIKASVNVIGATGTTAADKGYIRIINEDTGGIDNYVKGIHLGSKTAGSIGDVEIQGLRTYYSPAAGQYTAGSVLTISGR
ncbi:DUF6160 family protein [Acinetobacter sp. ANC 3813]|uniref:putative pilus system protein FilA n=1 Tax=Acinetobacter sp. ANC 3813 TaxID=1977873 RepID=UPI000A356DD5|nr:DUF6160 family protein [Acinetobacter sp. ANC 3813]OTG89186.1 pilus assembly protein FilA [Acinetobacter sp. ANC 3813]